MDFEIQFTNYLKVQQPTLVLPIVGLDNETISSGNSVVLGFGARRTKPSFCTFYLSLAKSQAAVPGGRI
jgi:hypothetical protein